jgi:hypothetical protein
MPATSHAIPLILGCENDASRDQQPGSSEGHTLIICAPLGCLRHNDVFG